MLEVQISLLNKFVGPDVWGNMPAGFQLWNYPVINRQQVPSMIKSIPAPIFAAGQIVGTPGIVHIFDSPEAFFYWTLRTHLAPRFAEIDRIVRRSRGIVRGSLRRNVQLAANTALEADEPVIRPIPGFTDPVGATFYETIGFGGESFQTGAAVIPDLSKTSMLGSIASARVSGVCLLTDEVNFGGTSLYLVGSPELEVNDLFGWALENTASAIIL